MSFLELPDKSCLSPSEITMGVKDKMAKAPQAPDASIALPELPDKEEEQVAAETGIPSYTMSFCKLCASSTAYLST